MKNPFQSLIDIFRPPPPVPIDTKELRAIFARRYQLFRRLLTANNNALEAMAELEKLYHGQAPYRMADINQRITTIQINVYKMVSNLLEMADGRYTRLEKIVENITADLDTLLQQQPPPLHGPDILPLAETDRKKASLTGEKMARLGEAGQLGISIPRGFIVTAAATRKILAKELHSEINRRLQIIDLENPEAFYAGCTAIQQLVRNCTVPLQLQTDIHQAFDHFFAADSKIAVRSSALGEDGSGASFAGLYTTRLYVPRQQLLAAILEVIASKYSPRAIAYRRSRGFRHEDIEMCIGCIAMVDAAVSGVFYSHDPQGRAELIRINAVSGIGKGVVDGTEQTSLYLLARDERQKILHSDGSDLLTAEQLQQIAAIGRKLENHFHSPQDMEWSIDNSGTCIVLQSRPLQLHSNPSAAEEHPVANPPLFSGGITAAGGVCCGEAVVIQTEKEAVNFPDGAVLVVAHPLPHWAPLLNHAAGVLAATGSEAGHLATVAREFSLPALFGCGDAIMKLAGQTLTLDADHRAIYRGNEETVLQNRRRKESLMTNSPVQKILGEALRHITPLTLNDPDSTKFKSVFCTTLHDITRFCHEKSVTAMFHFGDHYNFHQASAKQLIGDVPLEWWLIDLADGLREGLDPDADTVHIDDVVSTPMRAIWQGITACPWQGPPPVSVRGFGSIIFQSSMRPEFTPAVAAHKLNARNFFLISKNFCNLGVRLGYHYAMIESYISEFLTESYITFRFKGGAADMQRKAVRARLLAEVLERYDFSVKLQSDSLVARIKKQPTDYLRLRLMILGYLSLHARQLDMVMNQAQMVERYRNKFFREIEEMLQNSTVSEKNEYEQKNTPC
ncbi:MAG: pyruvate, water dikinase [Deltaproteobacteria bacterium]|nr:MAG: pyruvate, water dikinase [Deltaproteobacteria bacterium]